MLYLRFYLSFVPDLLFTAAFFNYDNKRLLMQLFCRPNHEPRESILVEFEFLQQNALKLYFNHLPIFGGETPTTKQSRTTYVHAHSINNKKTRKVNYEVLNDLQFANKQIKKHASPGSLSFNKL